MKALFLSFAAATLIGWVGASYGQQPPASARFATCSQTLEYCNSDCKSGREHVKASADARTFRPTAWLQAFGQTPTLGKSTQNRGK
jgi:hypothetical protein